MTEAPPSPADSLRAMPHNADAETAVLSCVLQWPDDCFDSVAEIAGTGEIFYTPAHKLTWKAIAALREQSKPVDLVTLTTELDKGENLEKVGGPAKVADLLDDAATPKLLPDYLGFLSESLQRRRIIQGGSLLVAEAYDTASDLENAALTYTGTLNAFLESGTGTSDKIRSIREVGLSAIDQLQDRFERGGELPGISTGFKELDDATNGFTAGKMHVVGARPGVGKTAIGFQFVTTAASNGVPSFVCSAEMFAEELFERGISSRSGVDGLDMRRGKLSKEQFPKITAAAGKLSELPVTFDDRAGMGLKDIVSGVRRMVRERGVKLVLVDYLQYIREPEGSRSRVDAVTKLSASLTDLAKETGVAMIVLAQLNRASESRSDRKPALSDLRDSGTIEQDAYGVVLMHEHPPKEDDAEARIVDVDLIVSKWRGGRLGPVPVLFEKPTSRFTPKHYTREQ